MRFIIFVFVLYLSSRGSAYIITVDSHAEECFFDSAKAGSKLGKNEIRPKRKHWLNYVI